jgi:hypothetical protein
LGILSSVISKSYGSYDGHKGIEQFDNKLENPPKKPAIIATKSNFKPVQDMKNCEALNVNSVGSQGDKVGCALQRKSTTDEEIPSEETQPITASE